MGGKERNKGELEGKRDKKKSLRNLENQMRKTKRNEMDMRILIMHDVTI